MPHHVGINASEMEKRKRKGWVKRKKNKVLYFLPL